MLVACGSEDCDSYARGACGSSRGDAAIRNQDIGEVFISSVIDDVAIG